MAKFVSQDQHFKVVVERAVEGPRDVEDEMTEEAALAMASAITVGARVLSRLGYAKVACQSQVIDTNTGEIIFRGGSI